MNASPIRVLVVDDNPDLAEMLEFVIGVEPAMECVGCLHTADRLAEAIRALRPDVLVLDAKMPGRDPLALVKELGPEFPGVRAIFYSGFDDPDFIEQVIDSGAWGFVSKRRQSAAVLEAIRSVAAGRVVFPDHRPPLREPSSPNS